MSLAQATSPSSQAASHAAASWPWYGIRASGLLSAVLLVLLMLSGIGLVTGYTFKLLEPVRAWILHRAMGIALGVSVLLHIVFILLDKYITFTLPQALVPFMSDYRRTTLLGVPVGSLWVTLGIFSAYLLALVLYTSLFTIDKAKRLWKFIHYGSYFMIFFTFFHGLLIGTDLTVGPLRYGWIAMALTIVVATLARLRRAGTLK